MDKPVSNIRFKLMSLTFKFRDSLSPRKAILKEIEIKPGFHVLDYGCGTGSYTIPLAKEVGESGKIYALDIHPLAIQIVQNMASKMQLKNVETILSGCKTGLSDSSVNLVLLYDTLHGLSEPNEVLEELHRVLKPGGVLSFRDHHMKEKEILSKITNRGLFKLSRKSKKTYTFLKEET